MLLFLRCLVFIGVCVEFVAAVAWLAELFPEAEAAREGARLHAGVLVARRPDGRDRQRLCVAHAAALPASMRSARRSSQDPHAPWRYTLMSGVIPAIPLILIRPFLPESPVWRQRRRRGHAAASEHRRAVRAGAAPHDDRHDGDVRRARTARRSARFSRCRRSCPGCRKCGRWSPVSRRLRHG